MRAYVYTEIYSEKGSMCLVFFNTKEVGYFLNYKIMGYAAASLA